MIYRITLEFTGSLDIPQEGKRRSGIVVQQLIAHLQQSAMTLVEALPVQSYNPSEEHTVTGAFVSNDTLATFIFEVKDPSVFAESHHYLHYVLDRLREGDVTVQQVSKNNERTVVVITEV